ncbi:hypothetical protein JOF56_000224 [Kibdelosporangium banguiense]|uniref:5-bromo-4-chloroindolyl phosphate hydrolysis protein n=1 Tax=Kibdelosporangium banguiense TaxID=1365924 RepID=A0ABS4T7D1_9PSEU|nr:hypothetical protein [Kibdelosporangium banguiense]MBP2319839.1 hypothetical protein [Kibdelosporangium banguiense]
MKYLGSTKNLAGSALGLVGVLLYVFGGVGAYWPVVVIGLYGVGALLAPGERVRLIAASTSTETEQLRADLAVLVERAGQGRLPEGAGEFVHRIHQVLSEMLARPAAFSADPDLLHRVIRVARVDLPTSIEAYLNMPKWLARRDELLTQLDLIEFEAHQIAERFYADDINRQSDHTRYLRERAGRPEH